MCTEGRDPPESRNGDRVTLNAEAGIRRAGHRGFHTRVYDLSPEGCRIEFVEKPEPGERVWVKFEGLESLEGSVRWVVGHVGGVKFERRIHGGVFERLSTIGR